MVREDDIVKFVLDLEGVEERKIDGQDNLRVYYRGENIMLVIEKNTEPLRVEIRCDRKLGDTLQGRYESVMQSRWLGKNGIEIICSGQLSDEEVLDLVRHAYEMSA